MARIKNMISQLEGIEGVEKRKMKVLHINSVSNFLSTGILTSELHDYIKQLKYESFVACVEDFDLGCEYKISNKLKTKVIALFNRFTGLENYLDLGNTKKMINYMDKVNPNVVVIGNIHSNILNIRTLFNYFRKKNIYVVIVLHDCYMFTGKCTHFADVGCENWKYSCGSCIKKYKDIPSYFFDQTSKLLQNKSECYSGNNISVVGVSKWITEQAKQSILRESSFTTIYNWVDLNVFKYNPTTRYKRFRILGVASVWGSSKGYEYFQKLSESLGDEYEIVLIGKFSNIEKVDSIMYVDSIRNKEELSNYYNSSDLFLQLSTTESFGLVVAEALACGVPVIALNGTANNELINEELGFIVNNYDDLLEKVVTVKERGRIYYASNCEKFAKKNFSKETALDSYIRLFESIVG